MKKLFIISNESIYSDNSGSYCDNLDQKTTPEGLRDFFEVSIIARKSKKKRSHLIKTENIFSHKNIFSYLLQIKKTFNINDSKYLLISITPYTFVACLLIKLFKKKPIVYLRSDGFGEYKSIFGLIGPMIYFFMFSIIVRISSMISCEEYILRGFKGDLVKPSQLTEKWFLDLKKNNLKKINLLYVGRIKVEKGIFSLLELLKEYKKDFILNIVGADKKELGTEDNKKVVVKKIISHESDLIKEYDESNIFILPSFTEGHPMVLYEALARKKPIIVFKEIEHVKKGRKGVFVINRDLKSLSTAIDYIIKNYDNIQKEMGSNIFSSRKEFIKSISNLINKH